jgi:2-succinyl-5-enolpyruvyl-6-hydroxy-3-cyclohexene-1-carboxylate synthase
MSDPAEPRAPENLLTVWADLLVDTLARGGVRDLVASPGSRSTPFLLAAARHPDVRVRSVIDERAAAFFALGLARVAGRPPALLCTSGTAPAHYFPAVIEASEAALPLVVLSADRPVALRGSGAPQTTDQVHLYGAHVRAFADLGDPRPEPRALRGLQRAVARTVAAALAPSPGPVHLNAPAAKPLEPTAPRGEAARALAARAARLQGRALLVAPPPAGHGAGETLAGADAPTSASPPTPRASGASARAGRAELGVPDPPPRPAASAYAGRARRGADPDRAALDPTLDHVAAALAEAQRPALVAGPLGLDAPREAVLRFAASRGLALLPETTSQLRLAPAPPGLIRAGAFDLWLRADDEPGPDVVLEIGATPTSAAYARWLERAGPRHRFVLGGSRFRDPSATADAVRLGDLAALLAGLAERLPPRAPRAAWREAVRARERRAWAAVNAALEAAAPEGALQEGAAVRALVEALPPGALLALGNSLPIRHADRFVPPGAADVRVLCQRGVNGIDGWIAGAAGAAAADGGPTVALIGDVAFAHDLSSLGLAAAARAPLVLAVIDNGGGRIFEQLPIARAGLDEAGLALFTTPPALDVPAAARAFGLPCEAPTDEPALRRALEAALARAGATVLHLRVPAHGAAAVEARIGSTWRAP